MDTCLYNGHEIYSWDLRDEDNQYDKELLRQWIRASEKKELYCPECNEYVFLKAGDKKEPHFSHYSGSSCPHNNYESEESQRGKRLLINLAKRSFPGITVDTKYKMPDGKYSTVFIQTNAGISIDFHYNKLQNINYDERSQYYIQQSIPFLHVFSGNFNGKIKDVGAAQKDTIQRLQGFCIFLNMHKDKNFIAIEYELPDKHPTSNKYEKFTFEDRITNYQICDDGSLLHLPTNTTIHSIIKNFYESKLHEYNKIRLELDRKKAEQEANELRVLEEAKATREKAEIERKIQEDEMLRQQEKQQLYEQMLKETQLAEQKKTKEDHLRKEAQEERDRMRRYKEFYNEMQNKHIIRTPYNILNSSNAIFDLGVINESWILPPLLTRDAKIYDHTPNTRDAYLKELSTWLHRATKQQQEQLIHNAINRIENVRFYDEWNIHQSRMDFSLMKECGSCNDFNKFLCRYSYDDGWCKFTKCVSPNGVCIKVKKSCEYCHHSQI